MAGSCVFALFSLLLQQGLAATLHAEAGGLVRKEVDVAPNGHLHPPSPKAMVKQPSPKSMVKTLSAEKLRFPDELTATDRAQLAQEFCRYDFPLGKEGTNDCEDSTKHSIILDEGMCIDAAEQSGASTSHNDFALPNTDNQFNEHPQGCFKNTCNHDASKVCYYYNGDGILPTPAAGKKLEGTPVCSRPRYLNSTQPDTNGGCPAGYAVIDDEEACRAAANCQGLAAANYFRIGVANASEHRDRPRGCFVDIPTGKVYINEKSAMPTGTNVKGLLLCNVTQQVHWGSASQQSAIANTSSLEEMSSHEEKAESLVQEQAIVLQMEPAGTFESCTDRHTMTDADAGVCGECSAAPHSCLPCSCSRKASSANYTANAEVACCQQLSIAGDTTGSGTCNPVCVS